MSDLNSFFGEGTVLKGTLKFKGLLRFDGEFEGEIQSESTLIVGNSGKVKANVKTCNLYNFGEIVGDIDASDMISLHANSKLEGNINSPVLVTEEFAFFQGSCTMPAKRQSETASEDKDSVSAHVPAPGFSQIDEYGAVVRKRGGLGAAGKIVSFGGGALFIALIAWVALGSDFVSYKTFFSRDNVSITSTDTTGTPLDNQIGELRREGATAFSNEDYELAMSKFAEIVEKTGEDVEALGMLGASAANAGQNEKAIEAYEKLASINPNLESYSALAELYEKTERKGKLISTLKTMSEMAPDDRSIVKRLKKLAQSGKVKANTFKRLADEIGKDPENPKLRLKLAKRRLKRRSYIEALKVLEKGVKDFPARKDLRLLLAQTLHRTGREKDALEHYVILAKAKPDIIEAVNNTAFSQLNQGLLDDAAAKFRQTLKRDPNNFRGRLGLAMVYSKMEENEKAAAECQKILDRSDDYAPAMNRLAWIFVKQGVNLDKAEELSKKSLLVFPDIPEYIDTLSEINFKKGNHDKAIRLIKRAVKLIPDNPYYKRQLFKFRRAKKQSG